jgi:hypothetical protein
MPTKISNTNTNINRININVPRQRNAKVTPKSVKKAEQDLQNLETQDRQIQYSSQAPSQFINPSVFGFNTTPIQNPIQNQQTEELITSPRMTIAEPINRSDFMPQPIPFRSSGVSERRDVLSLGYSQPQYTLPSDFQNRLAEQEGFQPSSRTFKPIAVGKMRDIQKQGRPDINEMALKVKEAYRGEELPFAKEAAEETTKKGKGGRQKGSKNKPKPKPIETQTGESLARNVNTPQDEVLSLGTQFAQANIVPRPKGALRGKKDD